MASGGQAALRTAAPRASPLASEQRAWPLVAAGVLAVAGLGLLWRQFAALWSMWTTDNLRSIGVLVIPTSVVLSVRALRRQDFAAGSWWGVALVALALAVANLQYYGSPSLIWGLWGCLNLLPVGLVLYLYAGGAVVLLGGLRAWRKAGFGLFLLLFVNPVPIFFTSLVDLPLQRLGAEAARSVAALLAVPLSGGALRLMFFHDEFGMFIAPGCNGLQGVAAMGLLALVIGHLRGLRLPGHALFVAGAVALAFLLNLLRLCLLVLYYCLAHLSPTLGSYAVGADYAIGAVLFMLGAAFLFAARTRTSR
jgi:exosortase J